MKTAFSRWIPALTLTLTLAAGVLGAAPVARAATLVDATGAKVALPDTPSRIVTLAPSLGELAADIAGDSLQRIVGVSEYTDYPPALAQVRSVGPYMRVNLEAVLALKPDLVLATLDGNSREQVLHLRELGLPVVVVSTSTLKQVYESIRTVGAALGDAPRGERMARQLETGIEKIRARGAKRTPQRVLLQIGADPLVVVGRSSFLHEALEVVGGKNVYGDSAAAYPRPSLEDALKRDPETILVLALGHDLAPFRRMAAEWKRFPALKANQLSRVHVLQGDPILRPTLRMLEGVSLLERAVHADR